MQMLPPEQGQLPSSYIRGAGRDRDELRDFTRDLDRDFDALDLPGDADPLEKRPVSAVPELALEVASPDVA